MKNKILILLTLLPLMTMAQVEQSIDYPDYMAKVREGNLAYAAEKLNIPIADANIRVAKIFNDPSLAVEYANNDDSRMQMGQGVTVGLSKTFSPGKRSARIDLARSEKELSTALLEDFFSKLRADATIAYFAAIKQKQLYELQRSSYQSISELAKADSIKFTLGKITETDAMQSRLEAGVIYNELLQAQSDLQNAYAALNVPLGKFRADTLYVPTGGFEVATRRFSCADLLAAALDNRADLVAAMKNVDVAEKALKLAHRERNMDFDLSLGYNYNTEVRNTLAPAPKFSGMTIGLTIPLKFSNFNRGTIQSAAHKAAQAEKYYQQAQLEVQTEVYQNYGNYLSFCAQVERFNQGMLDKAKAVIEGKTYSYNRGETSLLEVLNAQRTYNEVRAVYIETLFNHSVSLITLERSAGIWDIR
ncbi:MAG: TolC family protein [Alistipes sp.]